VIETLAVPLAVESKTDWEAVATPDCVLNVSCCGEATTVLVCASAVAKQNGAAAIIASEYRNRPVFFTNYSN
jgi:hypothetical protein